MSDDFEIAPVIPIHQKAGELTIEDKARRYDEMMALSRRTDQIKLMIPPFDPDLKLFGEAKPGDHTRTFEFENGDLIGGEYGWVTDEDFIGDHDQGVVLRKTWFLVSVERRDLENEPCDVCDTEGTVSEEGMPDMECPNCKGEGYLDNDWKKVI